MRYPPSLLDEIRARLPVSQVVARKVKLKRQGREFAGLSPFKVEKTPSFFVNDQKGFYHCFASGEHGDVFDFLIKMEGLSFPEAVERLAADAGVALPKPTAREAEHEDKRARLYEVVEAASRFFSEQLMKGPGRDALRYAEGRGLSRETLAHFRIGFAPDSRSQLKEHLATRGFSGEELAQSGLIIHGPDIPVPYDRFRNRLMFPITDLRERVIAFGGRALAADVKAKYLNSPETPLFHKGAQLFNAAKARASAHERRQVIVVEGYMDAIALYQAGFEETVAPLGTALTEDQLALLWRFAPEPTLCFDGDGAGRRAAYRALETALPHLRPGQSLRFAFLPDGLDPDDLIRHQGTEAFAAVVRGAVPLIDVLFRTEQGSASLATPEGRASLDQRLMGLVQRIGDPAVRDHYRREVQQALRSRHFEVVKSLAKSGARRQAGPGPQRASNGQVDWKTRLRLQAPARMATQAKRSVAPAAASSELREGQAAREVTLPIREAQLARTLINHPWLIDDHAEAIAEISFHNRALAGLRDAILQAHAVQSSLDSSQLRHQLRGLGHERVLTLLDRAATHRSDRFAEPDATFEVVEVGFRHTLALHGRQGDLRREIEAAELAWFKDGSEEACARFYELNRRLHEARGIEAGSGPAVEGD